MVNTSRNLEEGTPEVSSNKELIKEGDMEDAWPADRLELCKTQPNPMQMNPDTEPNEEGEGSSGIRINIHYHFLVISSWAQSHHPPPHSSSKMVSECVQAENKGIAFSSSDFILKFALAVKSEKTVGI